MSKYNYLQVNCGCNGVGGQCITAYAEPKEYEQPCDGCEQMAVIKRYDEADDPEYFINVAEGELEMYNHHSRVNAPRQEYERRTVGVTDATERLRIAKEICEAYVNN